MNLKSLGLVGLVLPLLLLMASGTRAHIVELDGKANSGWHADDLTKSHLYIANPTPNMAFPDPYYYRWTYDENGDQLPWNSLDSLVDDLANNILDNAGDIPVGDWKVESGGDVFAQPEIAIWKGIPLAQGWYELRLTPDSQAYNLSDYDWPQEASNPVWNAYVEIFADYGDSFQFGDWSLRKDDQNDVLEEYRNQVDGMQIHLAQSAQVYFYINDFNSVDNADSVTLDIQSVPLPATLPLLSSGLAFIIIHRRRRR